jgi:pantothenate kinase type III
MILTIDVGNTQIKGAVLRMLLYSVFVFEPERTRKNILNIKKHNKVSFSSCYWCLQNRLFLVFKNVVEIHISHQEDVFLFIIYMKHHIR